MFPPYSANISPLKFIQTYLLLTAGLEPATNRFKTSLSTN